MVVYCQHIFKSECFVGFMVVYCPHVCVVFPIKDLARFMVVYHLQWWGSWWYTAHRFQEDDIRVSYQVCRVLAK